MVYQWRLDALEVQINGVEAVMAVDRESGNQDLSSASSRATDVVAECCRLLDAQHAAAIAAFEERASHYALSAPTTTGHIKRFAASEAERQVAIKGYRDLASDLFSEVKSEVHFIGQILETGPEGINKLRIALERRTSFWLMELEETWNAWNDVTARMHSLGEEAMVAWQGVVQDLEVVRQCLQQGSPKTTLQQPLVGFAAKGLEVELVNSLGLSGLSADIVGEGEKPELGEFSQEKRVRSLTEVLQLLHNADLLHEVGMALGEALIDQDGMEDIIGSGDIMPTPQAQVATNLANTYKFGDSLSSKGLSSMIEETREEELPSFNIPVRARSTPSTLATPSAAAAVNLAAVARMTPSIAVRLATTSKEDNLKLEGVGVNALIPWLTECLVEATCKAVERGQGADLIKLLKLCRSLGSEKLATAVYRAATQLMAQRSTFWSDFADMEGTDTQLELQKLLKVSTTVEETYEEEVNEKDDVVVVELPSRAI
jgi:hypothetical protein